MLNEYEMRKVALDFAIRSQPNGSDKKSVVERAQAFYDFLTTNKQGDAQ